MQQGVKMQSCSGGSGGRARGKQRWVQSSMGNRVEGEGPGMDRRGGDDVDGVAGEEGGRVPWDDGVG